MLPWWPALGRWPWSPSLCPHWFQRRKKKTGEGRAAEENISLLVSQKVDYKGLWLYLYGCIPGEFKIFVVELARRVSASREKINKF